MVNAHLHKFIRMISRKITSDKECVIGVRSSCIAITILVTLLAHEAQPLQSNGSWNLDRHHVSVWFDSPIRSDEFRYEKSNIKQMLNLIAGTFDTIVVKAGVGSYYDPMPPESNENTTFGIALMAAEHNKNSTKKLKAVVGISISAKSLASGIQHADKANAIFPGTVDTLLLHSNDLWNIGRSNAWWYKKSTEILRNYSKIGVENGYKVGIIVQQLVCSGAKVDHSENETVFLSEIVKYIDLIVPIVQVRDHPEFNAEKEHQLQVHSILDCEHRIKLLNKKVAIIPIITCNPPRHPQVSNFIQCWQLMSDWAKGQDRKVIMFQAFDKQFGTSPKNVGWWRRKYQNSDSFNETSFIAKTEEKIQVGFMSENERMDNYTAIFFNHRVRYYPDLKFYSEQEIRAMLNLISTRFSTIMTSYMPYLVDFESQNVTWIASIVAKMNRENQNSPDFKPLKVISTFHREDETPWKHNGYLGSNESPLTLANLEVSLKVARDANEIYPGTVSTIAYSRYRPLGWDVGAFPTTLENVVGNKSIDVRLGVLVHIEDFHRFKLNFNRVSNWVNVVILDISLIDSRSNHLDTTLLSLFDYWKERTESIRTNYSHVEFQFAIACVTVVPPPVSLEDVTNCWRIVNDFGRDNQVQIILYQAFDTPFTPQSMGATNFERLRQYSYSGWWKLKNKTEVTIQEDSFFEKIHFQDQIKNKTKPVEENPIDEMNPAGAANDIKCFSNNNSSIFISLLVGLAVICVVLTILLLYLYYNKYYFLV